MLRAHHPASFLFLFPVYILRYFLNVFMYHMAIFFKYLFHLHEDAETQRVFLEEFGGEDDEDDDVVTVSTPKKTAEVVQSSNASASITTDISSNPTPSTSSAEFLESPISKNSAQSSTDRRNAPNLHQIHAKFQHWDGKSLKGNNICLQKGNVNILIFFLITCSYFS